MAILIGAQHRLACFVPALLGCACSSAFAQADILWRNTTTGDNVIWKHGDHRVLQAVASQPDQNWQVAGTARSSFNGALTLIWRNRENGRVRAWPNAQTTYAWDMPTDVYRVWSFGGTGFFNTGTHLCDILWRDTSGRNVLYRMGNESIEFLTSVSNPDWKIVGVGDFDDDLYSDILWRNTATGANVIWLRADSQHTQAMPAAGVTWQVVGVGDFDGDGPSDILWRDSKTGRNVVWNWGHGGAYARDLVTVPTLSWHVVGVGDFNGDHMSDVLWRDSASGRNVIWPGADGRHAVALATVADPAWVVAAVADFTPRYW